MALVGFELAIPASDRPHTRSLDRSATAVGHYYSYSAKIVSANVTFPLALYAAL